MMSQEAAFERSSRIVEFAIPDSLSRFQLYGTHWRTVEPSWKYPMHAHHYLEINLVVEGEQVTVIDDQEWVQRAGDILYIKPWAQHSSRVISDSPMTYMCLHVDMDDEVLYPLLAQLECAVIPTDLELNRRLRSCLDQYLHVHEPPPHSVEIEANNRIVGMQLVILLVEWALANRKTSSENVEPALTPSQLRYREKVFLEKKVKEWFAEHSPMATVEYEAAMLPSYRWIGVYTIYLQEKMFWAKTDRFAVKMLIEEALEPLGTVVVIVREPVLNAVVFSNHFTVPPMEDYLLQCKAAIERHLHIEVPVTFSGMTSDITEAARIYRSSVQGIENEPVFGAHSHDFIHRMIRDAMDYMEREYTNSSLSLSDLAKTLDITPNYLSSLFRSQTGLTFSQHLLQIRLHHAKQLLRDTKLRIYEIAEKTGYTDYAYFSRVFRKVFSVSPQEYRTSAIVEKSKKS